MSAKIKRRDFISLLGGAAVAWPLAARAQQPMLPFILVLHQGAPEKNDEFIASFRQGLRQSGYEDEHNVKFEFRWSHGRYDQLSSLAADLVRRNVSVIAAAYLPAALAAKSATTTIPIVFVSGSDPVEAGLVASLNRPGANVTGITITATLGAKRLELLRQMVPKADTIAALANPTNRNTPVHIRDLQAAAQTLGQNIRILNISTQRDFETVFATLAQQRPSALLLNPDTLFYRTVATKSLPGQHTSACPPCIINASSLPPAG